MFPAFHRVLYGTRFHDQERIQLLLVRTGTRAKDGELGDTFNVSRGLGIFIEADLSVTLPNLKRAVAPKPKIEVTVDKESKQAVTLPSLFG